MTILCRDRKLNPTTCRNDGAVHGTGERLGWGNADVNSERFYNTQNHLGDGNGQLHLNDAAAVV